ncbi:MAG: penicillin-binding protein activator LpoB [Chitinivibrionales bacterium]|nr:penicillin-binding protein activator LpoB [Chitinivibrionales bacterium]
MNCKKLVLLMVVPGLILFLAGCAATKVSRIEPNSTIDITGKWNDTDSRLVSQEMIQDCLNQRWLFKYEEKKVQPTVIVGKISNKSHEHISVETFTKDLERALLNSGKVNFVASKVEREELRDEKADQAENASEVTKKESHEETGADVMLIGTINTIVDQEGGKAVVFYQTNLELVEIESNQKVWIGEKKIKKFVERAKTKF